MRLRVIPTRPERALRLRIGVSTLLLVCLVLMLTPGRAEAETRDHTFAVEDSGRASCAAYTRARAEDPAAAARYIGFIEGYLTAANRYEPNTFDLTPWHTTEAFQLILDQHCSKNPSDRLALVSQQIVVAMMPIRLADSSDLIEVGEGENRTLVYQRILWRAQDELTRRGLYRGQVNGQYTPELKSALMQFQQLASLDPSGVPDVPTLWVLLNP